MASDKDDLRQKLDNAIASLNIPGELKETITNIIMINLEHDRVQHFLNLLKQHQPADYVDHVVVVYENQHEYVTRVQEGEDDVWYSLYEKMQRWAFGFLRQHNFSPSADTWELAVSYAGEAGGTLIHAHYPYDVPVFDAWAIQLVKNVCRKNMKQATNQRHIPENQLAPLEDHTHLPDGTSRKVEQAVETEYDLDMIMSKLNKRDQVVMAALMTGMKPQELAAHLETTLGNAYKIKHDVIQKMRKIFQE